MKKIFFFALIGALSLSACTKDSGESIDDVCTKMRDINFMKYCYENFDANKDGKVSIAEAEAVPEIDISNNKQIMLLDGIEYFSHIERFNCNNTNIYTIDLSKNKYIVFLFCKSTQIESIDLRNLSYLALFEANNSHLKNVYFADNCLEYGSIDISGNNIQTIDISNTLLDKAFYYQLMQKNRKEITVIVNETQYSKFDIKSCNDYNINILKK